MFSVCSHKLDVVALPSGLALLLCLAPCGAVAVLRQLSPTISVFRFADLHILHTTLLLLLCISQLYDAFSTYTCIYINTCITMPLVASRFVIRIAIHRSRYDSQIAGPSIAMHRCIVTTLIAICFIVLN